MPGQGVLSRRQMEAAIQRTGGVVLWRGKRIGITDNLPAEEEITTDPGRLAEIKANLARTLRETQDRLSRLEESPLPSGPLPANALVVSDKDAEIERLKAELESLRSARGTKPENPGSAEQPLPASAPETKEAIPDEHAPAEVETDESGSKKRRFGR